MPLMFKPARDPLEHSGVPDVDTSLPLAACQRCGEIVCCCMGDEEATSELQESAQRPTRHVTWRSRNASSWPSRRSRARTMLACACLYGARYPRPRRMAPARRPSYDPQRGRIHPENGGVADNGERTIIAPAI